MSDAVAALHAGDEATVNSCLRANQPRLMAFIRAHMGPSLKANELTADILQSACREVLPGLAREGPMSEGRMRAWFYRAARHKIAERARYHAAERRATDRSVPLEEDLEFTRHYSMGPGPLEAALSHEECERFVSAFGLLTADEQRLIELACVVRVSRAELALELEIEESAVNKRLSRARARLATLLSRT